METLETLLGANLENKENALDMQQNLSNQLHERKFSQSLVMDVPLAAEYEPDGFPIHSSTIEEIEPTNATPVAIQCQSSSCKVKGRTQAINHNSKEGSSNDDELTEKSQAIIELMHNREDPMLAANFKEGTVNADSIMHVTHRSNDKLFGCVRSISITDPPTEYERDELPVDWSLVRKIALADLTPISPQAQSTHRDIVGKSDDSDSHPKNDPCNNSETPSNLLAVNLEDEENNLDMKKHLTNQFNEQKVSRSSTMNVDLGAPYGFDGVPIHLSTIEDIEPTTVTLISTQTQSSSWEVDNRIENIDHRDDPTGMSQKIAETINNREDPVGAANFAELSINFAVF